MINSSNLTDSKDNIEVSHSNSSMSLPMQEPSEKATLPLPENTEDIQNAVIAHGKVIGKLSKPKIEVRFWLIAVGAKPKYLDSVTIKAHDTKVEFHGRQYKVIVDSPAFKEGKDTYIYDCDVNNTVGGLGFEKPDIELTAKSTATLLKDFLIEATFGKGGLPMWLFAILAIGTVAGIFVAVIVVPQYIAKNDAFNTASAELREYKTYYPPPPKPVAPTTGTTVTNGAR